jgi:diguanylate cyclase (GGDEF)-like protein
MPGFDGHEDTQMMLGGMKILAIGDDPALLELIARLLGDLAEVETARGGVQGLAETVRILPDLILCDLNMSDLDGLTFCRHLRADILTRNIPVLCLSDSNGEAEELAALAAGAVDVIDKPVSPLLVRARVKIQIELCVKSELLLDLGRRDPLTGIFNRRYFAERLEEEWARHKRTREPVAVAMVDLDRFKEFNDHYGHVKGDECLLMVVDRLRHATRRPGELVARYGGEEFILLLPGTPVLAADAMGRRICQDVQEMRHPHTLANGGCVTVSVGLASAVPDDVMRPLELIRLADEALYEAKATGRNCHVVKGTPGDPLTRLPHPSSPQAA